MKYCIYLNISSILIFFKSYPTPAFINSTLTKGSTPPKVFSSNTSYLENNVHQETTGRQTNVLTNSDLHRIPYFNQFRSTFVVTQQIHLPVCHTRTLEGLMKDQ